MNSTLRGFTKDQLDDAQARYGLTFPPDLIDLLREQRLDERYDWSVECPAIREKLRWPFDLLLFDVEHGFWWPDWGNRPDSAEEQAAILEVKLSRVPKLIPLCSHRFLPETPSLSGNPVFSMHGFDTIYYGADLRHWLENERSGWTETQPTRRIAFWSDLVEGFERAYDYYQKAVEARGGYL